MIWPERPDNWRDGAAPAQAAFACVANTIAEFEPVTMCVSAAQLRRARRLLSEAVTLVEIATNDAWARDTAPTFVQNAAGEVRAVDWIFNAWGGLAGGLYRPWDDDQALAAAIARRAGVDRYAADFVLEGGAIHVDGEGSCLTTEECLLNPNRNPGLARADIEARLRAYLGVREILWLGRGVHGDETDGHIDNLACFLRPGVVALAHCDRPGDPQTAISGDAKRRLAACRDARGRALDIIDLPVPSVPLTLTAAEAAGIAPAPGTHPRRAGDRLAASYVNFYLANGAVIVPAFGDPHDACARDILAEQFPARVVRQIPSHEILLGGGNVHCITQQQPA